MSEPSDPFDTLQNLANTTSERCVQVKARLLQWCVMEIAYLRRRNSSLLAEVQVLSFSEAKLLEVNGCGNERQGACRGYKAAKAAEGNEQ